MSDECIFCKIIKGDIETQFVYDDDEIVAFKDIHPQAPIHLLVVPKKHIPTVNALDESDAPLIGKMVLVAKGLAKDFGVNESGYRLIINVERGGGQLVFHIHMHLVGGWENDK